VAWLVLLLLVSTFLICLDVLRRIPLGWYGPELIGATLSGAFLLAAWMAFLPCCIYSYSVGTAMAAAVGLGLAATGFRRRWQPPRPIRWPPRLTGWLLATLPVSALLAFYFYTSELPPGEKGWFTGISAWQDIALHSSLISYWDAQPHFVARLPLCWNTPLPYHFLLDFLSLLFYRTGMPLGTAMLIPVLGLALSLVQMLYFLCWRAFRSQAACLLFPLLFLCGGSPWGVKYFLLDAMKRPADMSFWHFLVHNDGDWSNQWDKGLYFSNVVTSSFLPQRPIMFGYCAVAFIMLIVFEAGRRRRPAGLWVAAALTGLMPLGHVHAFLMCLGLLVWNAGLAACQERRLRTAWSGPLLLALLLAAPQLLWLKLLQGSQPYLHLKLGWELKRNQCVLTFWAENMGPAFYFLWLNGRKLFERRRGFFYRLYLPALLAFGLANVVLLQPAEYDNIKILLFVYMLVCMVAAFYLVRQSRRGIWVVKAFTVALVLAWTATGFLTHIREINGSHSPALTYDDVLFGERLKQLIPPGSVVACLPDVHMPVTMVAGREVLLGYPGFVESYGLPWAERAQALWNLLAGKDTAHLIREYHVSYVIGDRAWQNKMWFFNYHYFDDHYRKIYDGPRWIVYRTDQLR
jgi:hypothetical protein